MKILRPGNPTDPVFQSTDDMDKYRDLYTKMDAMLADVGFTETEVSSLYQCLAAILHIANVEFEQDPDSDTVMISDGIAKVSLANAADVLGVDDWEELETCLLTVNMEVKGERMVKFKSERQARDGRDALARELYSVLFYGVIDRINRNLQAEHGTASSGRKACIRLLDISGFENVAGHNGFEQFVINATNEKLHQYFLDHTFTQEKREYEQEGLKAVDIAFADNKHIVDLIFKKPDGLIPLLEDINAVNGTDDGWLNKCRSQNHSSPPYNPTPNAKVSKAFAVTHYAGQNHNNDYGDNDDNDGDGGGGGGDDDDDFLVPHDDKLQTATPVFVRCIKPNLRLKSGHFDSDLVRSQLLSNGLLEVTQIRKDGYPIRIKFADFVKSEHCAFLCVLDNCVPQDASQRSAGGNDGKKESGFSSASGATTSHVPDGVIIKIGESTLPDISEETAEEEKRKKKKEKERKEGAGNQPAYNIFRLTERDFEYSKEFEMKARRCVRFVLYVIIFILILGGGVVARVALLWLGSAEFMLIPLIIGWLSCVLKVMFGSKDWPTLKALVVMVIVVALFFAFNDTQIDMAHQTEVIFTSFGRGFSDVDVLVSHFTVNPNTLYLLVLGGAVWLSTVVINGSRVVPGSGENCQDGEVY
nr:hypothetical protein BaRGS_004098 [Batillaria attramentaria]